MGYVVGENCIKCKYTSCVDICPVDAFRESQEFLVIDPEECIDCSACEPECPADAIFHDNCVPEGQDLFVDINLQLSKKLKMINSSKDPLPNADTWLNQSNKLQLINVELNQ